MTNTRLFCSRRNLMQIFNRYADLLKSIQSQGYKSEALGLTPDRAPIICVKSGGEKKPAIFISAGSHSTEQAGVTAAVRLLDQLETEHQVYVIPSRDPMGMNGFSYVLSLSLGEEPRLAVAEVSNQFSGNMARCFTRRTKRYWSSSANMDIQPTVFTEN